MAVGDVVVEVHAAVSAAIINASEHRERIVFIGFRFSNRRAAREFQSGPEFTRVDNVVLERAQNIGH